MDQLNVADIPSAAAMSIALLGAFIILLLVAKYGPAALGSPRGWSLLALGLVLASARMVFVLLHDPAYEILLRGAGILAAAVIPAGLFLVLRQARHEDPEPTHPAGDGGAP